MGSYVEVPRSGPLGHWRMFELPSAMGAAPQETPTTLLAVRPNRARGGHVVPRWWPKRVVQGGSSLSLDDGPAC
jgi:hypothetical protein